jgi:hypothetical protein
LEDKHESLQESLAFALLVSRQGGWHVMEPQVTEAAMLAARAVELDDSDPWAHLAHAALTERLSCMTLLDSSSPTV